MGLSFMDDYNWYRPYQKNGGLAPAVAEEYPILLSEIIWTLHFQQTPLMDFIKTLVRKGDRFLIHPLEFDQLGQRDYLLKRKSPKSLSLFLHPAIGMPLALAKHLYHRLV